jgi:hypothetical protein
MIKHRENTKSIVNGHQPTWALGCFDKLIADAMQFIGLACGEMVNAACAAVDWTWVAFHYEMSARVAE